MQEDKFRQHQLERHAITLLEASLYLENMLGDDSCRSLRK